MVTTATGSVVPNAAIELRLMYDGPAWGGEVTCELPPSDELVSSLTDAAGEFSAELMALSIFPPDCAEVRVVPPATTGLPAHIDTTLVGWSLEQTTAPLTQVFIVLPD